MKLPYIYFMNGYFGGEWKIRMFEGSLKTYTKLTMFVSLISRKDLSLKMIEFKKLFFIEVIDKIVIFPIKFTYLKLEFYNYKYR